MEYFNYLGSMITNDARGRREIKSRIAVAKAVQQQEVSFHQQTEIKFKEETGQVLHLDYSLEWCWNLVTSDNRPEIPDKFRNVVL